MGKIILLFISIFLFSCNEPTFVEEPEKYFSPNDLGKLEIENFNDFWGENSDPDSLYISEPNYDWTSTFLAGVEYRGKNKDRRIVISVFNKKEDAIETFETKIQYVACVILEGGTMIFGNNKWWKSECMKSNLIIINIHNTLIEVSRDYESFEEIKEFLFNSAKELINRVDKLSQ